MADAKKIIYFDNAATTSPDPEVVSLYTNIATNYYANPSSAHHLGIEASRMLEKARNDILASFKLKQHEVIFTSGATEANNLALKGFMNRYKARGKHLIISNIEHPSIMNTANELALEGFDVSIVPVRSDGKIALEDIQKEMREDTILVSIMAVNNELGTIQPIKEIASFLKEFPNVHLHVDAVQAVGKIELPYEDIDLFTVSIHKLCGLKGSGLLIKRKNLELNPILDGGGQEKGYRSGTNDLASAMADALVVQKAINNLKENYNTVYNLALRTHLFLICHKDEIVINSNLDNPYIMNISLLKKKASVFVEFLSNNGIMVSTHSACSSRLDLGSSTLQAMGKDTNIVKNSIRISFSANNTLEEVERFIVVFETGLKGIRG